MGTLLHVVTEAILRMKGGTVGTKRFWEIYEIVEKSDRPVEEVVREELLKRGLLKPEYPRDAD